MDKEVLSVELINEDGWPSMDEEVPSVELINADGWPSRHIYWMRKGKIGLPLMKQEIDEDEANLQVFKREEKMNHQLKLH